MFSGHICRKFKNAARNVNYNENFFIEKCGNRKKAILEYTNSQQESIGKVIFYPDSGQIVSLRVFDEMNRGRGIGRELLIKSCALMQKQNPEIKQVWSICVNKNFWPNVCNKTFKNRTPAHDSISQNGYYADIDKLNKSDEFFGERVIMSAVFCITLSAFCLFVASYAIVTNLDDIPKYLRNSGKTNWLKIKKMFE